MSKELSVDREMYRKLEAKANELGITPEQYVAKIIREKTSHE